MMVCYTALEIMTIASSLYNTISLPNLDKLEYLVQEQTMTCNWHQCEVLKEAVSHCKYKHSHDISLLVRNRDCKRCLFGNPGALLTSFVSLGKLLNLPLPQIIHL